MPVSYPWRNLLCNLWISSNGWFMSFPLSVFVCHLCLRCLRRPSLLLQHIQNERDKGKAPAPRPAIPYLIKLYKDSYGISNLYRLSIWFNLYKNMKTKTQNVCNDGPETTFRDLQVWLVGLGREQGLWRISEEFHEGKQHRHHCHFALQQP